MRDIRVNQAKRYGICSCTENTTLLDAANDMIQEDISCLVVLDKDGWLAGIISRTDIVIACQKDPEWQSHEVSRNMSKDVVVVSPKDSLDHAANLMIEHHIHRVVIAESDRGMQKPLGVLSDADLLYHMVKYAEQEGTGG